MKEKALPIIQNVYQNQGSMFKMIQVPFTDGNKTMTIVTNLEKANEYLEKNIYTEQPLGFTSSDNDRMVCKLQKSIYGFKQASLS